MIARTLTHALTLMQTALHCLREGCNVIVLTAFGGEMSMLKVRLHGQAARTDSRNA